MRQPVTFLFVGGVSAVCYVALDVFFARVLGIRPGAAVALAMLLMLPPSYLAHRRLTFRSSRRHLDAASRYVAVQVISNVVGALASETFSDWVVASPWAAFTVVTMIVATINYGLMKFWTFVHSDAPASSSLGP